MRFGSAGLPCRGYSSQPPKCGPSTFQSFRLPSAVRMNAPLLVPTRTRTPAMDFLLRIDADHHSDASGGPDSSVRRPVCEDPPVTDMTSPRHDWTVAEVVDLLGGPFHELLAEAHAVHAARFDANVVEGAILLSIKTGGCPEDCAYCPQAARYHTGVAAQGLLSTEEIVAAARNAKTAGATRFCMGAAWRSPNDRQVDAVADAARAVGDLGLETCATLGMLTPTQASTLAAAGLDYYNHN